MPAHQLLLLSDGLGDVQLRDIVLRGAARLNVPIGWIPGRLSEQNFNLEEPPTKASPWVGVLLNHLRVFRQRLETAGNMSQQDIDQVHRHFVWKLITKNTTVITLLGNDSMHSGCARLLSAA